MAAHKQGWFEVVAGKSVVAFRREENAEAPPAKCFGFVQTYDKKPRRRLWELMKSQGLQENQQVVFMSDLATRSDEEPSAKEDLTAQRVSPSPSANQGNHATQFPCFMFQTSRQPWDANRLFSSEAVSVRSGCLQEHEACSPSSPVPNASVRDDTSPSFSWSR
jgi:hypothetical protein